MQKGGQPCPLKLGEARSPACSGCWGPGGSGPLWPCGCAASALSSSSTSHVQTPLLALACRVRGWMLPGNRTRATAVCGGREVSLQLRLLFFLTQAFRDPTTVDSVAALAATACPQRCFSRKAFSPRDLKECQQYP